MLFNRIFIRFLSTRPRSMSGNDLLTMARSIIPSLGSHLYKGQCGKIAVIGGCKEYTGAPYFAAISALKVGADISYVYCTRDAAPVIKSYSPELIVHPILDDSCAVANISEMLPKLHCLVIGPGLGREEPIMQTVRGVIEKACSLKIPLVIDADGIFALTTQPNLITGCAQVILTPNKVEFARFYAAVTGKQSNNELNEVQELSRALNNVTIVKKGPEDIICNAHNTLICSAEGSTRRCGGQGDLLAGSMGTFNHWAHLAVTNQQSANVDLVKYGPTMCAAYAACLLTRHCAKKAFKQTRRSTTTTDMIATISDVFNEHFEQ